MEGATTPIPPRIRSVLEEVPALILVFGGPRRELLFANAGGPDLLGPRLDPVMRTVFETGQLAREREWRHGDRFWDVVVVPMREDPDAPVDAVSVHAVDVTRLLGALRAAERAEHRFTQLFAAETMGVTISDERDLLEVNDAFLTMLGRTRADLQAGLDWTQLSAPEYRDDDARAIAALQATGETAPYEKEYLRPDGSRVAVIVHATLISRSPFRVLATLIELTERRAAERAVAMLLARTRRLQQLTAALSASNSAAEIARAVVHHALEELSASAGVLVREDGGTQIEHAVGFPPAQVDQWRAFPGTLPEALLAAAATTGPAPAGLIDGTLTALPLIVADRRLGSLGLAFRGERGLGEADADFLAALANLAAAALDRAALYENRAWVARKLQEGLLPESLAPIPGLETAVVYESISGGGEVGGDFYDVFEAVPGRWAVAVGDVCGKGTEAAVVTGLARHTVRAAARVIAGPADVLEFLNGALRRHGGPPAFCTVGYLTLAAAGDGFAARASSGGHPYPLVLRADGTLEEIGVTGTMLGVAEDPRLDEVEIPLASGDALVVYTDGVTDARAGGGERFGDARLFAALRGAAGGDAATLARAVETAVRGHLTGASIDDRAIVVLRVT